MTSETTVGSNHRPPDLKSNALTTRPPRLHKGVPVREEIILCMCVTSTCTYKYCSHVDLPIGMIIVLCCRTLIALTNKLPSYKRFVPFDCVLPSTLYIFYALQYTFVH